MTAQTSIQPKDPAKSSIWDLEEQFSFYGQYHTDKTNVAIHIFCVPTIWFTSLILFARLLPYHVTIPVLLGPLKFDWIVNLSTVFYLGYAGYFVGLEPVAGGLYAPILLALGYTANYLAYNVPGSTKLAGWAFGAAWIAQFIGHGKFEGRAPALLDSLFQSLVLAVFFVFMEVLFMAGYRPELHKRLQNRIGKAVLAYRQQKKREGKPDGKSVDAQTVWRG